MKKIIFRLTVLLTAILLVFLAVGCGGLSALVRSSMKKGPAPNFIFIHPNPVVGDFAEYTTEVFHQGQKQSETKIEVSIAERRGQLFLVKTRFVDSTEAFTKSNLVGKMAFTYLVDRRGNVKQAWYHDLHEETKNEIPIVEEGAKGYVRYKRLPISAVKRYSINSKRYRIARLYRNDYKINDTDVVTIFGVNPAVKFGMVVSAVVAKTKVKDLNSGEGLMGLLLRSTASFKGMEGVTRLTAQGRK